MIGPLSDDDISLLIADRVFREARTFEEDPMLVRGSIGLSWAFLEAPIIALPASGRFSSHRSPIALPYHGINSTGYRPFPTDLISAACIYNLGFEWKAALEMFESWADVSDDSPDDENNIGLCDYVCWAISDWQDAFHASVDKMEVMKQFGVRSNIRQIVMQDVKKSNKEDDEWDSMLISIVRRLWHHLTQILIKLKTYVALRKRGGVRKRLVGLTRSGTDL